MTASPVVAPPSVAAPPAVTGFNLFSLLTAVRQKKEALPVVAPGLAISSASNIPVFPHVKTVSDSKSARPLAPVIPLDLNLVDPDVRRASKQFTSAHAKHLSVSSQQSAAAHIAVQHGDKLQNVCYGPVQFADISAAYNDSALGRTVLDYPLLKRLDEAIFHRDEGGTQAVHDGVIRSYIITAETRLLLVVQQFMITAALLPAHMKVFPDVEPDPLIKFVDDAEALIQYIVDDLHHQQDLFAPSAIDLAEFVQERCHLALSSEDPSFYFRHEVTNVTMKYVQGLCETICGLWPNGKFFVGAEGVNPRDSFTPAHLHRDPADKNILASHFDKYFNDQGVLGHVVAIDFRQLFRGAFPFLVNLGRWDEATIRPDRERDMRLDAGFVEKGVFKFEKTMLIREHLLVDSDRKVRVYVDDFEGTRYIVYFNHRIGR
jgi:hypothetical protein